MCMCSTNLLARQPVAPTRYPDWLGKVRRIRMPEMGRIQAIPQYRKPDLHRPPEADPLDLFGPLRMPKRGQGRSVSTWRN